MIVMAEGTGTTHTSGLFDFTTNLTARHYKVLIAAFLGWIFDGYETYVLVVAVSPILGTLLTPTQQSSISFYAGLAVGITLLGWAVGGVLGGVLTDYIGRKRMMIYSVLGYAIFTGLTSLSTSVWMLVSFRFLTGLALGSEWETGTALLAEAWPDNARSKGAGIMQSGFGFGSLIGAAVWFLVQPLGPQAWRYMFALGILPALFVLYLRTGIGESQMWLDAIDDSPESNDGGGADDHSMTDSDPTTDSDRPTRIGGFTGTVRSLLSNPDTRKLIILGSILSLSTTAGWWAVNFLVPEQAGAVASSNGDYWASVAGIVYTVGAVIGYLVSGWVADGIGRRPYLWFIFVGSFLITPITFFWTGSFSLLLLVIGINGFFTLGGFAWFPIYLPELFDTKVRGSALGLIFNSSRFVAFLFPIGAGTIIATFGGTQTTAVAFGTIYLLGIVFTYFMPETNGRGLPDA